MMVDIATRAQAHRARQSALSRQASDATIEMFYFMASQVSGAGEIQPTGP